jgi:ribosomal RNA-processing protein 1
MIDEFMTVLSDTPLNAEDAKIPNGMRYHMLDIYLDELEKIDDEYEAEIPAEKLFAPFVALQKNCLTRTVRERAKELLEDERVRKWLGLPDTDEDEGGTNDKASTKSNKTGDDWGGFED